MATPILRCCSHEQLGFDLCLRLKALKERHPFLPRGSEVPEISNSIFSASLDLSKMSIHWDELVHLTASVYSPPHPLPGTGHSCDRWVMIAARRCVSRSA
jgi:hypothetical protein